MGANVTVWRSAYRLTRLARAHARGCYGLLAALMLAAAISGNMAVALVGIVGGMLALALLLNLDGSRVESWLEQRYSAAYIGSAKRQFSSIRQ